MQYFTYVAMLSGTLLPSLKLCFYIFFTIFGQKKKSYFFLHFAFFSPTFPHIAAFPNTQQGFKWEWGWYRGDYTNHIPHGMGRLDAETMYAIGEYINGKKNGHHSMFYSNGSIMEECDYIDGMRHGRYTSFNRDGNIREEIDFTYGTAIVPIGVFQA